MATYDLTSPETLRLLHQESRHHFASTLTWARWRKDLGEFITWVQAADLERRASLEFQTRLWDSNPVSAVGQGDISVKGALADPGFRRWLAEESLRPLPREASERITHLQKLFDEILVRLGPHVAKRPHLKTYRVLTAFFPDAFTSIAAQTHLSKLHRAMFGDPGAGVACHARVLARLDEVLTWNSTGVERLVERMTVPWFLYDRVMSPAVGIGAAASMGGPVEPVKEEPLQPLPAIRRRRGLTAIKGSFQNVLRVLDFVADGVAKEDVLAFLRADSPEVKDATLGVVLNVLQAELAVIRRAGDQFVPTELGEALLETEDPGVLAPWLLTHILGPDAALVALRESGSLPSGELVLRIQSLNPNWTSTFVPQSILSWLRSFGFVASDELARIRLTELGKLWAARIHWVPEALPAEPDVPLVPPDPSNGRATAAVRGVEVPLLSEILTHLKVHGEFEPGVVATLHAGLWAHPKRHFAVLTGLSGSGKTLLARGYALALAAAGGAPSPERSLCTVPVSPGWTDSSAILGYVNPLQGNDYVATPFLHFLIRCHEEPTRPHFVVFDEMNLSHPEQYLAPFLSGMETGAAIELHRNGDSIGIVPESIPYPANLVILGTVNMDETTHGLSDKVLDRALTLEFWKVELDAFPDWGKHGMDPAVEREIRELLEALLQALSPARLHFGWRVVKDILGFVSWATRSDIGMSSSGALDRIVYAKVLPKLRGDDSERFRKALSDTRGVLEKHGLRASLDKVVELEQELRQTGSARFWR